MSKKTFEVVLSEKSIEALDEIYQYLSHRASPNVAQKVVETLLDQAQSLNHNPRRYSKFLNSIQTGNQYRSFFTWDYRIVYEVTGQKVKIINFIHGARDERNWIEEL